MTFLFHSLQPSLSESFLGGCRVVHSDVRRIGFLFVLFFILISSTSCRVYTLNAVELASRMRPNGKPVADVDGPSISSPMS